MLLDVGETEIPKSDPGSIVTVVDPWLSTTVSPLYLPEMSTLRSKVPACVKTRVQLALFESISSTLPMYTGLSPEARYASFGKLNPAHVSLTGSHGQIELVTTSAPMVTNEPTCASEGYTLMTGYSSLQEAFLARKTVNVTASAIKKAILFSFIQCRTQFYISINIYSLSIYA